MISFDKRGGSVNLTPVWNAINSLSSSISSLDAKIGLLPTDLTTFNAYLNSISSSLSVLNDTLSNYLLSSDAFNSSVLTDYAKTSDIPTNTGGGGKYQYAFSELPSDANYGNLYNITGNVESMTFNTNLLITMAGGYFNSNSLSVLSLFNNNLVSFCDNIGNINTLELNNCKTLFGNNLTGNMLSLNSCSIMPNNTFSYWNLSFINVSISSLNVPSCTSFYQSGGRISSLTLSGVYGVDINCNTIKRLTIAGSGSHGACNISAYTSLQSFMINDFSAGNLNCSIGGIYSGSLNSFKILNMNCISAISNNTIENVYSYKVNCGSSFSYNKLRTITNCDVITPMCANINFSSIQTLNIKGCSDCSKNTLVYVNNGNLSIAILTNNAISEFGTVKVMCQSNVSNIFSSGAVLNLREVDDNSNLSIVNINSVYFNKWNTGLTTGSITMFDFMKTDNLFDSDSVWVGPPSTDCFINGTPASKYFA